MATVPIDEGFISVREYLRTSYSPDCEYVGGRVVERLWVFDPWQRVAWQADRSGMHRVNEDALTVPGTAIRVVLREVFAELDRV